MPELLSGEAAHPLMWQGTFCSLPLVTYILLRVGLRWVYWVFGRERLRKFKMYIFKVYNKFDLPK